MNLVLTLGLSLLALFASTRSAAATYSMTFSGRLTGEYGRPVAGPVKLQAKFFRTATAGNEITTSDPLLYENVALTSGVFQISLDVADRDLHVVFPDMNTPVFIEVTDITNGKTYPRQRLSVTPLALKIPVDQETLTFNDQGQLTLNSSPAAGGNLMSAINAAPSGTIDEVHLPPLAGDVQGNIAATRIDKIQGQTVDFSGAASGNILQWNGTQWGPASLPSGSESDVATTARNALSASAPLSYSSASGAFSIAQANGTTNGYLSSADWTVFNGKQAAITGTSVLTVQSLASNGGIGVGTVAPPSGLDVKGPLRLAGAASGYVGLAPPAAAGSTTYTLPPAPLSGRYLTTDAAGVLTWGTPSTGNDMQWDGGATGLAPATARASLGLVIGTNVQSYSARLADVAALTPSAGGFIVGNGTNFIAETGSAARSSMGAAASGTNTDITSLAGLTTPLSVAQGGTGATTLASNRVLLGNGTGAPQTVAPGANGNVLTSNGATWTSAAPVVTNLDGANIMDGTVTLAKLAAQVQNSLVPPGTVVAFAGATPPAGWLLCNGAAVNRTTYAALFAAIGTAWGYGNQSSTFNVPDLRGQFLRGVDGGTGRDPNAASRYAMVTGGNTGNSVGSSQLDTLQSHRHLDAGHAHTVDSLHQGGSWAAPGPGASFGNRATGVGQANLGDPVDSGTGAGAVRHGAETRSRNSYVNYIIKY